MKHAKHCDTTNTQFALIKLGKPTLAVHLTYNKHAKQIKGLQAQYKSDLATPRLAKSATATAVMGTIDTKRLKPILKHMLPLKLRIKKRGRKSVTFFIPKPNREMAEMIADIENLAGSKDETFHKKVQEISNTSRRRVHTMFFKP